ncbi:MAG: hypothetical protein K2L70_01910 [Clostridia bacterium]|nr:hypothetical protein [Clostridia bacterium]
MDEISPFHFVSVEMTKNHFIILQCLRESGECCYFCPCADNRAVSVLAVRDPEGVSGVRAKRAALYALAFITSQAVFRRKQV